MSFVIKIRYNEDTRRISLEKAPAYAELVNLATELFGIVPACFKYLDDEKDTITVTNDLELREAVAVSVKSNSILRVFVIEAKGSAPSDEKPKTSETNANPQDFIQQLCQMFDPSVIESLMASIPNLSEIISPDGKGNVDIDLCDLFSKLKSTDTSSLPAPLANLLGQFGAGNPCDIFRNMFGKDKCATACGTNTKCDANNNNNNNAPVVHEGVTCDGCQTSPIIGTRYKCSVCWDYDLCESCEAKGGAVHDLAHPLLKIPNPIPRRFRGGRCHPHEGRPGWNKWGRCPANPANRFPSNTATNARFVQHVTMDRSGSIVAPAQKFLKVWRMRNEGTQPWSEHTALSFVGGDLLSAPKAVMVGSVAPGAEVDLSVEMVAPTVPGRYVSYWRLCGPDGQNFGHRLWVEIVVPTASDVAKTNDILATPATQEPAAAEPAPVEPEVARDENSAFNPAILVQAAREFLDPFAAIFGAIPQPQSADVLEPTPAPVPVAAPVPVPTPVAVPEPVAAPVPAAPAVPETTTVEAEILVTLRDMGFSGDLLTSLRKNRGDMMATISALLGQ